jgi:hypothetical protein
MFFKKSFSLPFSVRRQNTIKVSRFFSAAKKDYLKELEIGHLLFFQKCPKSKSQGVSYKIPWYQDMIDFSKIFTRFSSYIM